MSGIDRTTTAALLRISAAQIESKQINDVNVHIRDTHRSQVHMLNGRRRNLKSRTVTITIVVEGDHGDAWYAASLGMPVLTAPTPAPMPQIESKAHVCASFGCTDADPVKCLKRWNPGDPSCDCSCHAGRRVIDV